MNESMLEQLMTLQKQAIFSCFWTFIPKLIKKYADFYK